MALLGLALSAGCKGKPAVPAEAAPPPVQAQPTEGPSWALTLPMLDGYLRYQRTLLTQAGKLPPPVWDGGLKNFEEPTVEQKADLEERTRLEAGLSPDDVLKIEAIVSAVASRRLTYRMMKLDEQLPELPAPDPEDPTKGVELAKALESHGKLRKAMVDLLEERQTFGTRNIDLLLEREDELLKNWGLMLEVPELSKTRR